MIKVVFVDDEVHCTESLQILLKKLNRPVEIIGKFNNPLEALPFIKSNSFDILFLDIEMPGMSGFELLHQINDFKFDVVFTTAYDQYAIKAFRFSALNYLLKPIDENELEECLNLWEKKSNKALSNSQFSFFLEALQNPQKNKSKIALPTTDGFEFIEIDEIIRCQSDSNYTNFYLKNGDKFLICRTLKEVESILQHNGFIRIHQSHLINPQYLKKYLRNDGGNVVMQDGVSISVSKNNKSKIVEIFEQIDRTEK
ncbi:MAG: LytTR family DNA-binding domain-containing protein [Pelobium sp.]